MFLSKFIMVRWNGKTRKWYEDRGYVWTKQNDYFECKIEDVQKESTAKALVKCDYCGIEFPKQYRNYAREREIISKDCCNNRKCMGEKGREVFLKVYGVDNYAKLDSSKEKNKIRCKNDFSKIENLCKEKDLILISKKEDYENEKSELKVICKRHIEKGIKITNYANILKSKYSCSHCADEHTASLKRLDGKFVYEQFIKAGLEPQFNIEDYNSNNQSLPYICPNHREKGIQYKRFSNLQSGGGCYYCGRERANSKLRFEEEFVFNKMIERGIIPTEEAKYENKDKLIPYRCEKHLDYIQTISYNALKQTKQPCSYCRVEESMHYLNTKLRRCLSTWKKDSKKNCLNKCILTDNENYEIHHLISFNDIIKEALINLNLDINSHGSKYSSDEFMLMKNEVLKLHKIYPLGVCISKDLHILFHQIYSKSNNTIEQFEDFKQMYLTGKLNDILNNKLNNTKEVV